MKVYGKKLLLSITVWILPDVEADGKNIRRFFRHKTGKCMCEMGDHAARTSNSGRRIMRERSGQRMLSEYERIIGRS